MTISPFSASSEKSRVWRNTDGETDLEMPGSAPPEPLLRVIPTQFGVHAIVILVGEMDASNAHTVREVVAHCLARKPGTLSLDLSGLTFCGGGGIHSLDWALRRAEADNVEFRIVAPAPWLCRVLTAIQDHDLLAATSDPPPPAPAPPTDWPAGARP
ncbi:MAG TPA: STAS domain-containing protein [Pseudonocardia sp.]|uniref:STAS domain-containing protein n=1 Tax=Pseudonocardia sp. TaxID=60912 RepID=UPI002BADB066|nr:STAS domain-containing protein [Pseudonocardia sp.]HTF46178.1 STAS domain-containing protein [Pseudonocardia sp.]